VAAEGVYARTFSASDRVLTLGGRKEFPMLVINCSHPLTEAQTVRISDLLGHAIDRVIDVRSQFDHEQAFAQQAQAMIEQVGLSAQEWQTGPLVINLPSLSTIACLVLAELHGRMGYFPPVIRLRPVAGSVPPVFEVAEILNLQAVRDAARTRR
jgi:hypothetical protein